MWIWLTAVGDGVRFLVNMNHIVAVTRGVSNEMTVLSPAAGASGRLHQRYVKETPEEIEVLILASTKALGKAGAEAAFELTREHFDQE